MCGLSLNAAGNNFFKRIDTDGNKAVNQKELKATADNDGDGKVSDGEAAELGEKLGEFITDKSLVNKLVQAAKSDTPNPVSISFSRKVESFPDKFEEGKNFTKLSDENQIQMASSPADPPNLLKSKEPGGTVRINLEKSDRMEGKKGVSLDEWPPAKAEFTDPETGKKSEGYAIKLSTGDVCIIPKGQKAEIASYDFVGNKTIHSIEADGTFNDKNGNPGGMMMRYACSFATRETFI